MIYLSIKIPKLTWIAASAGFLVGLGSLNSFVSINSSFVSTKLAFGFYLTNICLSASMIIAIRSILAERKIVLPHFDNKKLLETTIIAIQSKLAEGKAVLPHFDNKKLLESTKSSLNVASGAIRKLPWKRVLLAASFFGLLIALGLAASTLKNYYDQKQILNEQQEQQELKARETVERANAIVKQARMEIILGSLDDAESHLDEAQNLIRSLSSESLGSEVHSALKEARESLAQGRNKSAVQATAATEATAATGTCQQV